MSHLREKTTNNGLAELDGGAPPYLRSLRFPKKGRTTVTITVIPPKLCPGLLVDLLFMYAIPASFVGTFMLT
jgi:hypothetical protein